MYFADRGCVQTLVTLYVYATESRAEKLDTWQDMKPESSQMQSRTTRWATDHLNTDIKTDPSNDETSLTAQTSPASATMKLH